MSEMYSEGRFIERLMLHCLAKGTPAVGRASYLLALKTLIKSWSIVNSPKLSVGITGN